MKADKLEILLFALATLAFLFLVLPLFSVLFPYKIITSEAQVYTFEIGAFRFIGTAPILVGIVTYFWYDLTKMNPRQKKALSIGIAIIIPMGLLPPWQETHATKNRETSHF
jgi:hypothetical protein